MLAFGRARISGGKEKIFFCLSAAPANGKRRCGCRRLFVAAGESGVERFRAGLGLCIVVKGDACVRLSAVLCTPACRDLGLGEMNFPKDGLLRLLRSRCRRASASVYRIR